MLALPILWLMNGWRALQNGWRRLWRRRVDYVRLELWGALPEFAARQSWWQRRLLRAGSVPSLMGLRRQLQRIAADPQALGVLLVTRDFAPGWATAESLRDELRAFRAAGKRVVVYMLTPDTRSYYALCGADRLLMPPSAMLGLLGLRMELLFLRDALALAGLEAEVTAVSPYKSAGDQFTRTDLSPENREQLERLLDQRFDALVAGIGGDRGLAPAQVRALIDDAPYIGQAACDVGLVDGLSYEDELEQRLTDFGFWTHSASSGQVVDFGLEPGAAREAKAQAERSKLVIMEWRAARRVLRVPYGQRQRRYVALVSVEGTISRGGGGNVPLPLPLVGGQMAGSDTLAQALRRVERSKQIAALVLYVDSPGGDAYASDLIWREVLRVKSRKPVVVAMGNVAASGGYYISACANAIIAQPSTLTGSIGVVSLRPITAGLLELAQVKPVVLTRGARTGLLSTTLPPTDDERVALRDTVFAIYGDFKRVVREGRGLSDAQLDPLAGGRVWTGAEARAHGLVDELGGLPQAIAKARVLAGLAPDQHAPVLRIAAGGRGGLPPLPFPGGNSGSIVQDLIAEALRPRLLAALPFTFREL